jgi:murein DD-endopeptidase MepM/ murein hydrolase activator NlpD
MAEGRHLALLVLALAGCVTGRPPVELKPHVEPDVQGVTHTVKPGETLWRIAKAYKVSLEDLSVANHLAASAKLASGQQLFVPDAKALVEVPLADLPPPELRPARLGDAPLAWPLTGVLYARFGPRGETRHDGIDIAAPAGAPVRAAADGEVLYAGEQKGYGHVVILQHAKGLITLYAHNSLVLVKEGQKVKTGDEISRVGEAVKTSGPHIHFEVREAGTPKDPLQFLPPPK